MFAKMDRSFASTNTGNSERSLSQITSRRCLVKSIFAYQSPKTVAGAIRVTGIGVKILEELASESDREHKIDSVGTGSPYRVLFL